MGVDEVTFADTIGCANPTQMYDLLAYARELWPERLLAVHLHDTRHMALAQPCRQAFLFSMRLSAGSAAARLARVRLVTSPQRSSFLCCMRWGLRRESITNDCSNVRKWRKLWRWVQRCDIERELCWTG